MDVILFRHAKKGFMPYDDPDLSPEGMMQSELLPLLVQKHHLPAPKALWASEKIRTHQTFKGLSTALAISTTTRPELNLRADFETQKIFQARVRNLIDELTLSSYKHGANLCIYLCTHYDWIEESMGLIPCDRNLLTFEFSSWAPAQYIHFKVSADVWKFIKKGVQP